MVSIRIRARDPAWTANGRNSAVTSGLLVRQNYTEPDIGDNKAEALAARMRAISDRTEVRAVCCPLPGNLAEIATSADVIINATVSTAVGQILAALAAPSSARQSAPLGGGQADP